MIVEQVQPVANEEEANDMIAGWRELPTLLVAYIRETLYGQLELVGLFEAREGYLQKAQKSMKSIFKNRTCFSPKVVIQ